VTNETNEDSLGQAHTDSGATYSDTYADTAGYHKVQLHRHQ